MITPAFDPVRLPYVSASAPGIGGRIKREPRFFAVEELALYEPCGTGEHVYLRLCREGWTTRAVIESLAKLFRVSARDIGCAGQKDKHARVTQTISIPLARIDPDEAGRRVAAELGLEVLWARRHANKLRRGHLLGNHFEILIEDAHADALARAEQIARAITAQGLPNFFGPQRFGADARNAERGRELLRAARGDWHSRFMLSAFQSLLFNAWLVERLQRGQFEEIVPGDVGKRLDNGALFDVADAPSENARMARREITYTGPIYGTRMRPASGPAGELELEVLRAFEVGAADLERARLDGSRRAARIFVEDLALAAEGSGLRLRLSLPKGAYATTLLREMMKSDEPWMAPDEEE